MPRVIRRDGHRLFVMWGRVGLTLWRRGAVTFQANGHMLQVVAGDWWKAMDRPRGDA